MSAIDPVYLATLGYGMTGDIKMTLGLVYSVLIGCGRLYYFAVFEQVEGRGSESALNARSSVQDIYRTV